MSIKLVTTKARKPKRYYGEEAEKVSAADQAVYDARIASMKAGTFDFSSVLVEAPKRALAVLVEE